MLASSYPPPPQPPPPPPPQFSLDDIPFDHEPPDDIAAASGAHAPPALPGFNLKAQINQPRFAEHRWMDQLNHRQPPPIRVQRSSPSPQPPPLDPSASPHRQEQHAMLADTTSHQSQWPATDGPASLGSALRSPSHRASHQRNASGSSVGSAGPASPADGGVHAHPYIAGSDGSSSPTPSYYDLPPTDKRASVPPTPLSFLAPAFQGYNNAQDNMPDFSVEARLAMAQAMRDQQLSAEQGPAYLKTARPAPLNLDHAASAMPARMIPGDVARDDDASSTTSWMEGGDIYGRDLPPRAAPVPNLDRTMSDAFQDELFDPSVYSSAPVAPQPRPTSSHSQLLSPYRNVFNERIQAANQARSLSPSSVATRERSPFRHGSPFAPPVQSMGSSPQTSVTSVGTAAHLGTASHLREQQKAKADSTELQQHQQSVTDSLTAPNTISPKEALLDFNESEDDGRVPLFPDASIPYNTQTRPQPSQAFPDGFVDAGYNMSTRQTPQSFTGPPQTSTFSFAPPSVPGSLQMGSQQQQQQQQQQQHQQQQQQHHHQYALANQTPSRYPRSYPQRSRNEHTPEFPAHLISMETSSEEVPDSSQGVRDAPSSGEDTAAVRRPARTTADGGTYTCTYHGCPQRFETPAKLQKHKREGHRQATPAQPASLRASTSASPSAGISDDATSRPSADPDSPNSSSSAAALLRNSQAGPHKCDRINPSTGKPCNTIFSRPYDLTRHEDTIHNNRKQKVRCQFCTEDKTFSRNDALTRHMRVVHPEVPFGGRTRRRPG